jgi:L-amino acid N-acyltransferase YncA
MRKRGACKFIAPIGDWNRSALKLSKACGFIEEGRIKKAYIRDNKFHAMVMMGSR